MNQRPLITYQLYSVIGDFASEYQKNEIKYDALLTDRIRTSNKSVMNNISVINEATVFKLRGESFRGKKLETVSLQTGKVQAVEPMTIQEE